MSVFKDFIFWNFGRERSQYLIFCLLIVAFIFLTPKSWFNRREEIATQTTKIIVKAPELSPDSADWGSRIRELTGNPNAQIVGWQSRKTDTGETFYEVEVR